MGPFGEKIKDLIRAKRIEVVLAAVSLALLIFSIILTVVGKQSSQFSDQKKITVQKNPATTRPQIVVDVAGSVKDPGVYHLKQGQRMYELIKQAGGLRSDADLLFVRKSLNQARILADQQKIYIPSLNESPVQMIKIGTSIEEPTEPNMVNINSASQAELENLPDVGPVTAKKIIQNRPFSSIKELLEKKILRQSTYDEIGGQLTL